MPLFRQRRQQIEARRADDDSGKNEQGNPGERDALRCQGGADPDEKQCADGPQNSP